MAGRSALSSNPELAKRSAEVLARLTGSTGRDVLKRGTCSKCGGEGHLTYQCTNLMTFEDGQVR
jgi:hypothetical protein